MSAPAYSRGLTGAVQRPGRAPCGAQEGRRAGQFNVAVAVAAMVDSAALGEDNSRRSAGALSIALKVS